MIKLKLLAYNGQLSILAIGFFKPKTFPFSLKFCGHQEEEVDHVLEENKELSQFLIILAFGRVGEWIIWLYLFWNGLKFGSYIVQYLLTMLEESFCLENPINWLIVDDLRLQFFNYFRHLSRKRLKSFFQQQSTSIDWILTVAIGLDNTKNTF